MRHGQRVTMEYIEDMLKLFDVDILLPLLINNHLSIFSVDYISIEESLSLLPV